MGSKEDSMIEELIEYNKHITSKEIAAALKVDKSTTLNHLHNMGLKFSLPKIIP